MSAQPPTQIEVDSNGRATAVGHHPKESAETGSRPSGNGNPFDGWSFKTDPSLHNAALFRDIRGRRVMAFLIDLVVMGVFVIAFGTLALILGILSLGLLWPLVSIPFVAVPFVYIGLMCASRKCGTFGMQWVGIEVRGANGRRPHILQTLCSWAIFLFTVPTSWGLALLVGLFNDRGRLLHDGLCGLIVIDSKAAADTEGVPTS